MRREFFLRTLWFKLWQVIGDVEEAGCGFRAAHAQKIPATKVSAETLAKQAVVSRKTSSRYAAGRLCSLAQPPRLLEIRRM
jgi:hypothetical protein